MKSGYQLCDLGDFDMGGELIYNGDLKNFHPTGKPLYIKCKVHNIGGDPGVTTVFGMTFQGIYTVDVTTDSGVEAKNTIAYFLPNNSSINVAIVYENGWNILISKEQ